MHVPIAIHVDGIGMGEVVFGTGSQVSVVWATGKWDYSDTVSGYVRPT